MKLRVISRSSNGIELGAPGFPNLTVRYVANRKQKTASGTKLTNLVRSMILNANIKVAGCKDTCATEALSYRTSVSGSIQNAQKVANLQKLADALTAKLLTPSADGFAPLEEVEVEDALVKNVFADNGVTPSNA